MSATEQLLRLPKWAQQQIRALTQQRDRAVRKLIEFEDSQTPSKVWTEEMVFLNNKGPEYVKQYLQADKLEVEHAGVQLSIRGLHDDSKEISLAWHTIGRTMGPVYFVPTSFQQARLVHPENV